MRSSLLCSLQWGCIGERCHLTHILARSTQDTLSWFEVQNRANPGIKGSLLWGLEVQLQVAALSASCFVAGTDTGEGQRHNNYLRETHF